MQSIKASEMTPLLKRIYESDGGNECLDVLMKYMYVQKFTTIGLVARKIRVLTFIRL